MSCSILPLPSPGCRLTLVLTPVQPWLTVLARRGRVGTARSLSPGAPRLGTCRLADGGRSVLPNVNGVKGDRAADKCKQVSF